MKINAQVNLVPNSSFEIYSNCPDDISQLNRATGWYNPTAGTPDYFNFCANVSTGVSVPQNAGGYQLANTGKAYGGIGVYNKPVMNVREYIQVQLSDTLKKDSMYCVSFYACLSNISNTAITQLGLYLSNLPLTSNNYYTLPVTAQITSPSNNYLNDTLNWVNISATYTAQGGENYITIGNFNNDVNTDTISWGLNDPNCFPFCYPTSYYYIDDVSILKSIQANAGQDKILCLADSVQLGNSSQSGATYSWQPITGLSNANIANPKASPSQTTTYYLTVNSACNTTADTVTVTVNPCDTARCIIFIPQIFSPNNDGNNDMFYVQSNCIATMEFSIYNQWGENVFKYSGAEMDLIQGWDGHYKNEACNTGVFMYYLKATLNDGKQIEKQGNVTLVK